MDPKVFLDHYLQAFSQQLLTLDDENLSDFLLTERYYDNNSHSESYLDNLNRSQLLQLIHDLNIAEDNQLITSSQLISYVQNLRNHVNQQQLEIVDLIDKNKEFLKKIEYLKAHTEDKVTQIQQLKEEIQQLKEEIERKEINLHLLYVSTSWKITAPLRFLVITVRKIKKRIAFGIQFLSSFLRLREGEKSLDSNTEISFSNIIKNYSSNRITVTSFVPFNFLPKNFGGGVRIMNVYEALSRHFNINLVGVTGYGAKFERSSINDNFTIYIVPMSREYYDILLEQQGKAKGYLHDILLTNEYAMIPELTNLCQALKLGTDIFISSHPYFFKMLVKYCRNSILVYEAHNVDFNLKKSYFSEDNAYSRKYLELVREVEEIACKEADFIMTVSEFDSREICHTYGVSNEKIILVPNGIDVFSYNYSIRKGLGKNVVFTGSAHGPNIEAVKFILDELAPKNMEINYTIIGNIKDTFKGYRFTGNVILTGVIDEKSKQALYQDAAVAINPMFSGSGTNLKVLEYAAFGLPIVSTPFGMRGLEVLNEYVLLAEKTEFLAKIEEILSIPIETLVKRTISARRICEQFFDKSVIISGFVEKIEACPRLAGKSRKLKRIAIEARVLHRCISGTERYISEILKNILLMESRQDYQVGLVNDGSYKTDGIDFYLSHVSLDAAINLYHRTYQIGHYAELVEFLLADRTVFTFHDLIACKYPDYFSNKADYDRYIQYMNLALSFSDRIIAISKSAKKDAMDTFGIPEDKIDVVYHGLDFEKFRKINGAEKEVFRKEFSIPEKYILYLGTDYPHKNLVNLFTAFALIMDCPEIENYYLVIAGNDYYRTGPNYLDKAIKPIKKRVKNLGYFPDDKIAHLYGAAELFVYPSLYEGFGFPVLEAFACETPLVCSNATSLPEVAGDAAYMVDATDPSQIARAIMDVITNPTLRESLVEKGKKRVREFTWEKCAKNTYEVYKKALDGPCSCPAKKDSCLITLLNQVREGNVESHNVQPVQPPDVFDPHYILSKLRQVKSIDDIKRLSVKASARIRKKLF